MTDQPTPTSLIDKLAYIYIVDQQILMTLSQGKDTYYIPGGKREPGETDVQAVTREVKEELNVDLLPESLVHYGTFEAQAHGKPPGTIVRMTCYTGSFTGTPAPTSEIQDIAYYTYAQRNLVGPVDQLIFDDLKNKNLIK
jgi:8-oxo-dGTP diphosphatase